MKFGHAAFQDGLMKLEYRERSNLATVSRRLCFWDLGILEWQIKNCSKDEIVFKIALFVERMFFNIEICF